MENSAPTLHEINDAPFTIKIKFDTPPMETTIHTAEIWTSNCPLAEEIEAALNSDPRIEIAVCVDYERDLILYWTELLAVKQAILDGSMPARYCVFVWGTANQPIATAVGSALAQSLVDRLDDAQKQALLSALERVS